VIVIDDEIGYCGSANWYRYSLEESREIVLRGPVASAQGLLDEVQLIWDQATSGPVANETIKTTEVARGYTSEVSDPVAAAKLKEVQGSFVIARSRRRR
jgi:phosphatidylserine/phosphatidylglycerophosphate/cardiolipin synthase-like enzyme